ncbi:MAG: hypothetical protein CML50_22035 [Rhodobacteraceae bacterium]|jgi:hypothetical protein|nr:hypothetical protein [Paracoccaceae bacterium]GGA21129.1 hypothetical protein GCM10011326_37250 [Salipiger profundus]
MLDLSLPDWAADVAPDDIVLFRFPVSSGSGIIKRRPCLVVDRRRSGVGNQTQHSKLDSLPIADLGIHRSKRVQFR